MIRVFCTVSVLLLVCTTARAESRIGLFGLLSDVHAYSDGYTTWVPLRGLAEWAGATVDVHTPTLTVALGEKRLKVTLRSAVCFSDDGQPFILPDQVMEIGGLTCVPARFWEGLGVTTRYVTPAWVAGGETVNVANRMNNEPVLTFTCEDSTATVLIHRAPPDIVAKVIGDFENQYRTHWYGNGFKLTLDGFGRKRWLGRYGVDWIMNVGEIVQGHFKADEPAEIDFSMWCGEEKGFWGALEYVYGLRDGRWRTLLVTENIDRRDWAGAGIPLYLAHRWGILL